jgi:hypothetical protein
MMSSLGAAVRPLRRQFRVRLIRRARTVPTRHGSNLTLFAVTCNRWKGNEQFRYIVAQNKVRRLVPLVSTTSSTAPNRFDLDLSFRRLRHIEVPDSMRSTQYLHIARLEFGVYFVSSATSFFAPLSLSTSTTFEGALPCNRKARKDDCQPRHC